MSIIGLHKGRYLEPSLQQKLEKIPKWEWCNVILTNVIFNIQDTCFTDQKNNKEKEF